MKKQLDKVELFQESFKQKNSKELITLSPEEYKMRFNLMKEENEEYLEACESENIVGIADALGDQLYVLLGTIHAHGLNTLIEDIFDEIHDSNMSKLDENGEPIFREDGKVLKGKNYRRPDIGSIIHKANDKDNSNSIK